MVQFKSIIFIIVIGFAVLFSGCTGGQDVTSAVKALPKVQQFMKEHPNAQITVTYWSKEEVAQSVQEISQQCKKPITPAALYKATVSEGDLKIVSWINAENQIVICSTTTSGGGAKINTTPTSIPSPILTATPIPSPISTTTPNPANKLKIIDLDAQQVMISESEIAEVLGINWKIKSHDRSGYNNLGGFSDFEIENISTGKDESIGIQIFIFPNATAPREAFSGLLLDNKVIATQNINIGDIGTIITFNRNNDYMIMFTENNVLSFVEYFSVGYTVDSEIAYELAKKQEEKISNLLDTIK